MRKTIGIIGFFIILSTVGLLENDNITIVEAIYKSAIGLIMMAVSIFSQPEILGYRKECKHGRI